MHNITILVAYHMSFVLQDNYIYKMFGGHPQDITLEVGKEEMREKLKM